MTKQDLIEIQTATGAGLSLTDPQIQTHFTTTYELEYESPSGDRRTTVYQNIETVQQDVAWLRTKGRKVYALTAIQSRISTSATRWEIQEEG